MLYDFYQKQNAKKPGTIHATYLLSGTKRPEDLIPLNGDAKKDGEDDYMQSSPFMNSSMPQQEGTGESSVLSITLVREEDLEDVRAQYEHISSIHIYSLEPHSLKDLQVLSDATRELQLLTANEDPLEAASKYGIISNKNVKRRAARQPPTAAAAPVPAASTSNAPVPAPAAKPKPEPKAQPSTAKEFFGKGKEKTKTTTTTTATSNPSSKEPTPAPGPATLKKESSSIFKSFAKAKPKLKREGTDSSVVEDSPMRDVDDDDEEETYVPPPQPSKEIVDSDRKARKERDEKLRRMMEEDDDDEAEVMEEPKAKEIDVEKEKSVEPEKEEKSVVTGGRRRGRRRIMKKKTVKDAEGYLVTKEEPVWESYSEDEAPPPPKPKVSAPSTAKAKKSTAKAGQGNIMSFFGKK
ncbi:DNA polymerase subunit Cdc27 [Hyaloscypha sp. PMI_1271]|nr:DNA polymerase subunit Cdc27 [Hyaloscypha sp. PMI_1271]